MEENKRIRKIEEGLFFVLIIVLFLLSFASSYSEEIISVTPVEISVSSNPIVFKWQSDFTRNKLIIDDVIDFSSPVFEDIVKNNDYSLNLPLNTTYYYWKIIGYRGETLYESKVARFYPRSIIAVESDLKEGEYSLRNTGNVPIRVRERSGSLITGAVILDIGGVLQEEVKNETSFRAEQA